MQNLGVTNKEHYGMSWYFLEWSIEQSATEKYLTKLQLFCQDQLNFYKNLFKNHLPFL